MEDYLRTYFTSIAQLQTEMAERSGQMTTAADALVASLSEGHKILLCGNGGSAADCQHMATELMSQLTQDFQRPGIAAIALTTDTSFITAYANDVGFDGVYERQVRALGKSGDSLVAISTSGNSRNVIRAVRAARELGLSTVGLTGEGGDLEHLVDHAIVVPSKDTQHVQEVLLPIEHLLCYVIERRLYPQSL